MVSAKLIIKICGLKTQEATAAAIDAGADMLGFVFFERSPRAVSPRDAQRLASIVAAPVRKVALLVDAHDALFDAVVRALAPDILQLHGAESIARATELRERYGLPVMKALGIATVADVAQLDTWAGHVDYLLVDAKPPPGAAMPGGHGRVFDWGLLEARDRSQGFMLSGGLTAANVVEAVGRTGAHGIDVSSGVESAPGIKDEAKIRAFLAAARGHA